MQPEIIPGILAHNLDEYVSKLTQVERAKLSWAHIDIMDGQFVPNISVMPHEIMGLSTSLSLEAHLMTYQPERYYSDLVVAGVQRVLIHRECYTSIEAVTEAVRQAADYFAEVGLVYNPETPVDDLSMVPVQALMGMGVHPGASGQPFISSAKETIKALVEQKSEATIAADGGVSEETIQGLYSSGVRRFVISSRLFVGTSLSERAEYFKSIATTL